jgi:serine/threonine protein kinase
MTTEPGLGTTLAGYRIQSLLGRGGMSAVYVAEDLRLKRQVALKVLAPALAEGEGFRDRFVRESQIAAGMEHPNIVPIYEAGESDGQLFIAMRWIRGTDLHRLLEREGTLDPIRAIRICSEVAAALDAAHLAGLVHRDVKPGNILVIEGGGSEGRDLVYLSDFGLTKRLASESALTRTGQFVGTIDYVAPEQIEGKPVDGRADVYSLACVLFQCLTGKVPYGRETEVAVLYAHLQEKPPRLTASRPDLPVALDRVFVRALSKSAPHRYATAGEFVSAVREALGVSSGERPTISAQRPVVRRRPPLLGAGIGAAALVLAVVVFAASRGGGSPQTVGSSLPTVTPSQPTQRVPTFVKLDRPPTAEEQTLLSYVPDAIRSSCSPSSTKLGQPTGAVACASGGQQVLYELYRTRDQMDAAFDQNVAVLTAPSGDCATQHKAFGPYSVGGERAGRVLCYEIAGRSQIEWTDERLFVYAIAFRPDLGDLNLFDWWADQAGPVDTTSASPVLRKDVTTTGALVRPGLYLTNISGTDTRSRPLRFNASKIGVGTTSDWTGTWALRLGDGTYALTHDGTTVEGGSYVIAKGPSVVFSRTEGTCPDAQPAAYDLTRSPDGTMWSNVRTEGACLPGPWPVNLHPFVQAPAIPFAVGTKCNGPSCTIVTGTAERPASAVLPDRGVQPVWSPDGSRLVFAQGTTAFHFQLYVVNADGTGLHRITNVATDALDPAWSPDGRMIAFHEDSHSGNRSSLVVVGPDGSNPTTLVTMPGNVGRPAWSPDGTEIAFRVDQTIYVADADGSNVRRVTDQMPGALDVAMAWTLDGSRILFWGDAQHADGLYSMTPRGTDVRLLTTPGTGVYTPDVSPDGRWVILGGEWDTPAPLFLLDLKGAQLYRLTQADVGEPRWRPTGS